MLMQPAASQRRAEMTESATHSSILQNVEILSVEKYEFTQIEPLPKTPARIISIRKQTKHITVAVIATQFPHGLEARNQYMMIAASPMNELLRTNSMV
jgi:hypothetical protein